MFVASDIAKTLGYGSAKDMARNLDRDEKGMHQVPTPRGGVQNMTVITEAGLYRAILNRELGYLNGEQKEFVKRFQRWVTHEVLPSIRKTGGYIPTAEADSDEDILAKAVLIAQKTINLKNQQLRAKDARIKELEPKAKALDDFTNVPDTLLVRDAAKILSNAGTSIGEKELREWLSQHGWTYRHAGTWWAASARVKAGHLVLVESRTHGQHKDGSIFAFPPTVKITRKGLALLHTRLGETRLDNTLENTIH